MLRLKTEIFSERGCQLVALRTLPGSRVVLKGRVCVFSSGILLEMDCMLDLPRELSRSLVSFKGGMKCVELFRKEGIYLFTLLL